MFRYGSEGGSSMGHDRSRRESADLRQCPGPYESGKCVHSVLHDKAQRKRSRTGPLASDCRGPRRKDRDLEPHRQSRMLGKSRSTACAASTTLIGSEPRAGQLETKATIHLSRAENLLDFSAAARSHPM